MHQNLIIHTITIIWGGLLAKLDYNERLYNFNSFLQKGDIINRFATGGIYEPKYAKCDDKNKDFIDRIIRGELVTSTEMNEIINIPHILSDGTESNYTFAEIFAEYCGWFTATAIIPYTDVISDVTWVDNLAYPKYITLHDDYIC